MLFLHEKKKCFALTKAYISFSISYTYVRIVREKKLLITLITSHTTFLYITKSYSTAGLNAS